MAVGWGNSDCLHLPQGGNHHEGRSEDRRFRPGHDRCSPDCSERCGRKTPQRRCPDGMTPWHTIRKGCVPLF